MLKKILLKFNVYEKYNRLITEEGKRIFIRTVYTLSICTVAIILIWYCGIINMASKDQEGLIPDVFLKHTSQTSSQKITLSPRETGEKSQENSIPVSADDLSPDAGKKHTGGEKSENKSDSKIENKPETGKNDKNIQVEPEKNKEIHKSTGNKQTGKKPDAKGGDKAQAGKKAESVQKTIYKGTSTQYVALTFDDGYNEKLIVKVLDVLKKNNLKATFFIIGSVLDDYPHVWKRAINEGHQICNHTLNHAALTKLSDQQVKNEILGWETCVRKVLGEEYLKRMKSEFPYLRLPGGNGNKSDRILSIAQDCGYKVIGWSLETNSSVINRMRKNYPADEIAKKVQQHVVNGCSGGSIILLHFNQYDITNIEGIVAGIKSRGYRIVTVNELLSRK